MTSKERTYQVLKICSTLRMCSLPLVQLRREGKMLQKLKILYYTYVATILI